MQLLLMVNVAMDASDKTFCDAVGLVKACIPWRWEAAPESTDFWMPDRSCRECYECSSDFTLLNRRHHCRHCGQIFCGKCSSNRIPATSSQADNIRVCNFCFKQWQHILNPRDSAGVNDHGAVWMEHNSDGECEDIEPVHYEDNGLLWLPPEPEYEDQDDDENAMGDLGKPKSSESADYRSSEEHKRSIMKNVFYGHLQASVAQLLRADNLPAVEQNDKDSWLQIITALSWEAATLLKLETVGPMDPRAYVKVKCLASGRPSESMLIKGVVCKKNVVHKRMASKIEKPRLLILEGALEYQRNSDTLFSFVNMWDHKQEMDKLKMAVSEIDAQRPDILLVEKSVSRDALDYLLERDISFVVNIKKPLLEHIARCTGGPIVSSIDDLSLNSFGYCDLFHVEKFIEEHGRTAGQSKTLMYFEGCPNPRGCTILLRGANVDELKKAKHVVEHGVFTAYRLALEMSFLADEVACPLNSSTLGERGRQEFPYSPSDQQSILVSLSSRCVWTGTVCVRSHLLRINYYGNFDKPLGRFLQDHLFDQNHRCQSCEMPTEAHVHCYTRQKGTLTILVKKLSEIVLPGERDGKIWMWHRCRKCSRINGFPPLRERVVMSSAALGMSFGKFLELSFSDAAADTIVASCGHSLHRNCLQFYGLGKMVACFRYANINLHSLHWHW